MRTSVSKNKLQSRLHRVENEGLAPGTGSRHTAVGTITEVYDQEKLLFIKPEPKLQKLLDQYPGLLFAKVLLANKLSLFLPFRDPEEYIYSVYGNAALLEGRNCKVEYEGMSLENGQVVIQRSWAQKQVLIPLVGNTLDIGGCI